MTEMRKDLVGRSWGSRPYRLLEGGWINWYRVSALNPAHLRGVACERKHRLFLLWDRVGEWHTHEKLFRLRLSCRLTTRFREGGSVFVWFMEALAMHNKASRTNYIYGWYGLGFGCLQRVWSEHHGTVRHVQASAGAYRGLGFRLVRTNSTHGCGHALPNTDHLGVPPCLFFPGVCE